MDLHLPLPGSAIDVLLVQDTSHHHDARSRRGVARIDAPVAIGPDLWLGPVSGDLAERIRGASEPPGENFCRRRIISRGAVGEDPIVKETRLARAKLFAECDEDLDKLMDRLKASEKQDSDRVVTTLREGWTANRFDGRI